MANYGLSPITRELYEREATRPEAVLSRIVHGFSQDRPRQPSESRPPWLAYAPDEVAGLRAEAGRALALVTKDEDDAYFADELRAVDQLLAHAAFHREWVVSMFEGVTTCFFRGGTPTYEPGDHMFSPHCPPALDTQRLPPFAPLVPLGVAGVLLAGLALAGWRRHRMGVAAIKG